MSPESELGHMGRATHVFRTLFWPVLGYGQWHELFCLVCCLPAHWSGANQGNSTSASPRRLMVWAVSEELETGRFLSANGNPTLSHSTHIDCPSKLRQLLPNPDRHRRKSSWTLFPFNARILQAASSHCGLETCF
jgi:hypothetical protein